MSSNIQVRFCRHKSAKKIAKLLRLFYFWCQKFRKLLTQLLTPKIKKSDRFYYFLGRHMSAPIFPTDITLLSGGVGGAPPM